ncbi:MAG: RDD family protein, partial [Nocardioides sp.]|nr:RDD family protein [Nocardioides sp.]
MSSIAGAAGTLPTAELDRRFYAFTLDRLLAWSVYAVAAWAAYVLLLDDGRTVAGIAVIAGTVVGVSLVLSFVLGLLGTSPGKAAVGLRVVDDTTGTPIGVGPAVLRTLILGVAALPTFGIGVATLAMTAVTDRERQRRGWHDHLSRSVVVDVRPAPAQEEAAPERPRQIVNLTAMRLVPASATPPREIPTRARRARWAAGPTADPTGGLGQLEVAAVPEALATPVGVPTPGPTPDITPAAPASESGPAAPLADVASSEAAPSTPAPSAAAPLRPAGASRWTAATAPPRDPDALVTPVVSDVPTVRGLPRTVEEVTSDALAHPTGVPGGAAAGRPRRGRRASG